MKKTIAIPYRLQKSYLTETEKAELAKYGDQLMTAEEIAEREVDEAKAAEERAQREKDAAKLVILNQLVDIDSKSIRALREGNAQKLTELETEAAILRQKLKEI